jgi:PEGA domain
MSLNRLRLARFFPVICAITLCAFAGCASSTVLQSQPPGARVTINGATVGNTPYTLTDTKIVGSTTPIHLELPGYQPLDVAISRSEELDVLPLIAGIFLLIPLLWVMKYQANHVYQLQPAVQGGYQMPPAPAYAPAPAGPAGYPPPPAGYPPPAGGPPH